MLKSGLAAIGAAVFVSGRGAKGQICSVGGMLNILSDTYCCPHQSGMVVPNPTKAFEYVKTGLSTAMKQ
jgi:hypothetical protein